MLRLLVVPITAMALGLGMQAAAQSPPVPEGKPSEPQRDSGDGPPSPALGRGSSLELSEVRPPVYYVPNADGRLVPMLNIPYERFVEIYQLSQQLGGQQQPEPYELVDLRVEGEVQEGYAQCQVSIRLTILPQWDKERDSWLRIPLRFSSGALERLPEGEGFESCVVRYYENTGHVLWLRNPQAELSVLLALKVPVVERGDGYTLRLDAPSVRRSQLTLSLGQGEYVVATRNVAHHALSSDQQGNVTLVVEGLQSDAELSWHLKSEATQFVGLEARGAVEATIEDPTTVVSRVYLRVQRSGGVIDRFRLRLPPQTRLLTSEGVGYSMVPVLVPDAATGDDGAESRPVSGGAAASEPEQWEVVLDSPSESVDVRLVTQTRRTEGSGAPVSLARYEVIDAFRQTGEVRLLTTRDWLVYWTTGPYVRRLPHEAARGDAAAASTRLLAQFEYYRQPCQIDIRVVARTARIRVEPLHLLRLEYDTARLTLELHYQIMGTAPSFLEVDLAGWRLVDVPITGPIDADAVDPQAQGTLLLPLRDTAPGDFTVQIGLEQRFAADGEPIAWRVPMPATDVRDGQSLIVEDQTLVVLPSDNLEVNYMMSQMPGVAPAAMTPPLQAILTARQDTRRASVFRIPADQRAPQIVCELRRRARIVNILSQSRVHLSAGQCEVRQQLGYVVKHEPLAQLELVIPQKVYDSGTLELEVDERPIPAARWRTTGAPVPTMGHTIVQVDLPEPKVGSFIARASYRIPLDLADSRTTQRVIVPLLDSRDGVIMKSSIAVVPELGLVVDASSTLGQKDDSVLPAGAPPESIGLVFDQHRTNVPLDVGQRPDLRMAGTRGGSFIDRAWLQTWITTRRRFDRLVLVWQGDSSSLSIRLPAGIEQPEVRALVNGRSARTTLSGAEMLVLHLDDPSRPCVVEVFLPYTSRERTGRIRFELPWPAGAVLKGRWFWQLLMPPDEHLLAGPAGFASSQVWAWRGPLLERRTLVSQQQLEAWTGATHQPAPPEGANAYVFTSPDASPTVQVRTVQRRWLVAAASSCALLVGLAAIYAGNRIRPAGYLIALLVLTAVTVLYPDMSLLVLQAAILGVVLSVAAYVMAWFSWRTTRHYRWFRAAPATAEVHSSVRARWTDGSSRSTTTEDQDVANVSGSHPKAGEK